MKIDKKKSLVYCVCAAMLAALATVATAYIKIPIPGTTGYVHLGDTVVYIAAALLPTPFALASGAIAGGLADVLAGAPIWAPYSIVIKALLTLAFTYKKKTILCTRNFIALLVAVPITVLGYFAAEMLIYKGGAVASIPWNLGQAVASALAFLLIASILDASKVKAHLNGPNY